MRNNPDGHEFLAVVATVHHKRVGESFDDRALCLAEPLNGEATSRVRDVDRGANLNVITAFCVSLNTSRPLKTQT